jgi:hypothetical protein
MASVRVTEDIGGPAGAEERSLGSAAEEAARLFAAVQDWARQASDGAAGLGEHIATGAPECSLCPVCRTIGVLRSLSPETYQHLADAADSLAAALRAAVVAPDRDGSSRRSTTVEHIDIG